VKRERRKGVESWERMEPDPSRRADRTGQDRTDKRRRGREEKRGEGIRRTGQVKQDEATAASGGVKGPRWRREVEVEKRERWRSRCGGW
jgi:hypothetical protein